MKTHMDPDAPRLLIHGTTLKAGRKILRDGWRPIDVGALIAEIAGRYELDASDVEADLKHNGRFALGEGRGSWTSFATTMEAAEHRWAQRAPEVEWETLWAVYRLRYGTEAPHWNKDVAGHTWVWDQMRTTELAVVVYGTTFTELRTLGAYQHGFSPQPLPSDDDLAVMWEDLPEIAIDLPFSPPSNRLLLVPVERHLPWDIYAHKLGLSREDFIRRADAGEFGEPASAAVEDMDCGPRPWWNTSMAKFPPG